MGTETVGVQAAKVENKDETIDTLQGKFTNEYIKQRDSILKKRTNNGSRGSQKNKYVIRPTTGSKNICVLSQNAKAKQKRLTEANSFQIAPTIEKAGVFNRKLSAVHNGRYRHLRQDSDVKREEVRSNIDMTDEQLDEAFHKALQQFEGI